MQHPEDEAKQQSAQRFVGEGLDEVGAPLDDGLRLGAVAVVHRPRGEEGELGVGRVEQQLGFVAGELQHHGPHGEARSQAPSIVPTERAQVATARWAVSSTRSPGTETETAQDTTAALLALYEWVDEWSQVARKVVKRRADLIQLGLAEKKARKTKGIATPKPV